MNQTLLNTYIASAGSMAIVGVLSSAIVQWLKKYMGGNNKTLIILAVVSLVAGTLLFFYQNVINWKLLLTDVLGILTIANTFWTLVLQWFEAPAKTATVTTPDSQNQSQNNTTV